MVRVDEKWTDNTRSLFLIRTKVCMQTYMLRDQPKSHHEAAQDGIETSAVTKNGATLHAESTHIETGEPKQTLLKIAEYEMLFSMSIGQQVHPYLAACAGFGQRWFGSPSKQSTWERSPFAEPQFGHCDYQPDVFGEWQYPWQLETRSVETVDLLGTAGILGTKDGSVRTGWGSPGVEDDFIDTLWTEAEAEQNWPKRVATDS